MCILCLRGAQSILFMLDRPGLTAVVGILWSIAISSQLALCCHCIIVQVLSSEKVAVTDIIKSQHEKRIFFIQTCS